MRRYVSRPPSAAILPATLFCLLCVLCAALAAAPEPAPLENGYYILIPRDGLEGFQALLSGSTAFLSGVLFLAALVHTASRWPLAALSLIPFFAGPAHMREVADALPAIWVSFVIEILFWRINALPHWWLGLRAPMVLLLTILAVWLLPLSWP